MLAATAQDRCLVMGVVNVTPDSFSDGGQWFDPDIATAHGLDLIARGADLIDVGGESTRPGALRIDAEEELRRVGPVIQRLVAEGAIVSVDTMRASTARAALDLGAALINDVSGGRADPDMMRVIADSDAPVVLMHWREHSEQMQQHAVYDDLIPDILRELSAQVEAAIAAGVDASRIIVDPGLGFSKTGEQNWTVLAHLAEFVALGFPLLVAGSRKRFLAELDGLQERTPMQRDAATAAVTTISALAGAWGVRVHEPAASADAVRVVARMQVAAAPGQVAGRA